MSHPESSPDVPSSMEATPTAVVGLGMMGSALARALVDAGHDVTVFNRSPSRAESFTGIANVASSVVDACRASEVVFVCVVNYAASDALLRTPEVEAALSGKVVVQLSTGTPASARDGAAWAQRCGIEYLEGVINVYPRDIGTPSSVIVYSGPRGLFDRCSSLLAALGGEPRFYGEEIGPYAAINLAGLAMMTGVHTVLYHCLAMLEAESVPFDALEPRSFLEQWLVEHAMQGVTDGRYPSGNGTMNIWLDAIEDVNGFMDEAGLDPALMSVITSKMRRSIEMGHGDDDLPALYEAFRPRE